jgi:hypothetical protein
MSLPDWSGQTVVCIASGPSLTPEDCATVKASGLPTVVTNTTFRLCPWADALYSFDNKWWKVHIQEVRQKFRGHLFTQRQPPYKGVTCASVYSGFRSFSNSGASAIALAIAAGSRRVVMLGYDCQLTGGKTHHHGDHPDGFINCLSLPKWPMQFARLAAWAEKRGAVVLNASRVSALTCFPRVDLDLG